MGRTALMVGLWALAGCRQYNPDWKGPRDESSTGVAPPVTATITATTVADTTDADTGSSSGSVTDTVGKSCNNDNMCPDGLVCGPEGCQTGTEGDPCEKDGDCQEPFPLCGPMSVCQAGAAGDPCDVVEQCAEGLSCTANVCA